MSAYTTYIKLWNAKDGYWWTNPGLGGDGEFSVKDFIALVLLRELSSQYNDSVYLDAWTELLVRSNRGWQQATSSQYEVRPTHNEGLLNWIFAQSGAYTRTDVEDFDGSYYDAAVPVAKGVVEAIINPTTAGHPEWESGWAADRPYAVGSYFVGQPYDKQLAYIYSYISAGCPDAVMLRGPCGSAENFTYILTGAGGNRWATIVDTPEVVAAVLGMSVDEVLRLRLARPR